MGKRPLIELSTDKQKNQCTQDSSIDISLISSYECLSKLKLGNAVEIAKPRVTLIQVVSDKYRMLGKLFPYVDKKGNSFPLDSWSEIVPAINRYLKTCADGKMVKTFYADDTGKRAIVPSGLHLFQVPRGMPASLLDTALQEAHDLYWNPVHRANKNIHMMPHAPPPACNMLFYSGCGYKKCTIKETIGTLFSVAPALAKYSLIYVSVFRDILKLDDSDMDDVAMALNHYDAGGAINSHVDSVFPFNGTLGPIFTVAMGSSVKLLDLLPVMCPETCKPVRVFSHPNEIMLMDGESRTLWAHAKPWKYPHEQYTLVFKFPELRTKTHAVQFHLDDVTLDIPYHYVSPIRESPSEVTPSKS